MAQRTKTPRIATIVLITLLVGLTLSVYPERAHACSCVTPIDHESVVHESEVIFMGRLVDTRTYRQDVYRRGDSPFVDFKFEVEAAWKGRVPQIAYMSAMVGEGAACADLPISAELIVGVRYIVYTYESMEFNLCSVVTREGGDEQEDSFLAETLGTFEEQVANLGPAIGFAGTGTEEWPPTPTPYPQAATPEPATPTPSPPSIALLQDTPTSPPAATTPAPTAGGCGRGDSMDLAAIGMLAGLAWWAGRRRNSRS